MTQQKSSFATPSQAPTNSRQDLARSLDQRRENYRQMHAGTAERMGKSVEFKMCRTLTQMRVCLWGRKKKKGAK